MRLQTKIILPIMFLLILVLTVTTTVSFYFEKNLLDTNMATLAESKLHELEIQVNSNKNEIEDLKKDLSSTDLEKARTLAYIIQLNPQSIESTESLNSLMESINIDEIHVTDEKGIITWTTVDKFKGFDFASSDQSKAFIPALTDKNFQLVQEPTERGADKVLFQYVGVARLDKPGIVQIGLTPKKLQDAIAKNDISTIASQLSFGKAGYVFIVDKKTNKIISHKDTSLIEKSLDDFDWGVNIKDKDSGSFQYTMDNIQKHMNFKTIDGYILCATIPVDEFTGGIMSMLNKIAVICFVSIVLYFILSYILIKLLVTNEIKKLLNSIAAIGKGDLTKEVDLKSSKEFKEFSHGISLMTKNLKALIAESIDVTTQLSVVADKLALSAEQSGQGAEDIAVTVNELAQTANAQAEGASRGAELAKDVFEKVETIARSARETSQSTIETNEIIKVGVTTIEEQNLKMKNNSESTKAVNNAVDELAQQALEIGNITDVITGIASQTNMLALNAAIEAARAGEVGKGFAVVADEVRKLAEGSTAAAKQISNIIVGIQKSVENAKNQVTASITAVEEQQLAVEHTQQAFEKIKESSLYAIKQVNAISEATNAVINNVQEIALVSESSAAASEQSAASTQEISASTQEQSAAMEEVSQMAQDLKNMVNKLNQASNKFRV